MNNEVCEKFADWLDALLENNEMPESTKAFNFNLYEDRVDDESDEKVFGIQLIAADRFDPDDDSWACDEVWTSEEDIFYISLSDEEDKSGEHAEKIYVELVKEYLRNGKYAVTIARKPVGIGFVDGDLNIFI